MPAQIRVGIVDDHPAVVAAMSSAVAQTRDLMVAGTGRTLAEALALLARVDVLLCDVQLDRGAEGLRVLETAAAMASPPAVVLLTGHGHGSVLRAAVELGAAGYLDKDTEVDGIVGAIRIAADGGTAFRARDLALLRSAVRAPSSRELQVVALVVGGATNAEIANRLGLSEKTIETHLHRLFDRYGVASRTELAVMAVGERWVASSGAAG